MTSDPGNVTLVGAGPGDPGLITVKGLRALRRADVVIHDRLIAPQVLALAPEDAEIIDAGKSAGGQKMEQSVINTLMVEHARRGKRVVRVKGGDPFVFGRGAEEVTACREAGVACRVIPGVSSALAGPAAAGIPVTDRRRARTVAFVTGRTADELDDDREAARYRAVAYADTVVILMSRGSLAASTRAIIAAGRDPRTPAAAIQSATTPRQVVVRATLGDIADAVQRGGLTAPLLTVIGDVAALDDRTISHAPDSPGTGSSPRTDVPLACGFGVDESDSQGPLAGRRIVLTRPRSSARMMARHLDRLGATVVSCPLIRISYDIETTALDTAIRSMPAFDWIILTSQHTVSAIRRRLGVLNCDARAFHKTRVAAIGSATARALRRMGLRADFVPAVQTGEALAAELCTATELQGQRVLCPRADIAACTVAERLRAAGAGVEDVIAYSTRPCEPPAWARAQLEAGVDALVFSSPSAVRQFAALRLTARDAKIACIGPTTARAAEGAGFRVDIVATEHNSEGLAHALARVFAARANTP